MLNARLNRLFAGDGRCFDVAVDHGFFGEASFLAGIEDMERAVATLVEAAPDAIQLSPGQARLLQRSPAATSPRSSCAPTSPTSTAAEAPARVPVQRVIANAVEQPSRLDAACVVVNLLLLPGKPELHHDCVRNVSALRAAVRRVGMPLMVEPLAMHNGRGGYSVDGDIDQDRDARAPGRRARRRRDQGRSDRRPRRLPRVLEVAGARAGARPRRRARNRRGDPAPDTRR